jgi:hypothetical protein
VLFRSRGASKRPGSLFAVLKLIIRGTCENTDTVGRYSDTTGRCADAIGRLADTIGRSSDRIQERKKKGKEEKRSAARACTPILSSPKEAPDE